MISHQVAVHVGAKERLGDVVRVGVVGLVVTPDVDAVALVEELLDDSEVLLVEVSAGVGDEPELVCFGERFLQLFGARRGALESIYREPFLLERGARRLEVEVRLQCVELEHDNGLPFERAVDGQVIITARGVPISVAFDRLILVGRDDLPCVRVLLLDADLALCRGRADAC